VPFLFCQHQCRFPAPVYRIHVEQAAIPGIFGLKFVDFFRVEQAAIPGIFGLKFIDFFRVEVVVKLN
jgi:hypothetical protein